MDSWNLPVAESQNSTIGNFQSEKSQMNKMDALPSGSLSGWQMQNQPSAEPSFEMKEMLTALPPSHSYSRQQQRFDDFGNGYKSMETRGGGGYSDRPTPRPPRESEMSDDPSMHAALNYAAAPRSSQFTEERDENLENQLFQQQSIQPGIAFDRYERIPVHVTGQQAPKPIQSFQELNQLHSHMLENIRLAKYSKPTPVQKYGLPILLQGRDLMACAQTGSGKTAAFLIPIINRAMELGLHTKTERGRARPFCLILAPTRELACQIFDETRKFAYRTGIRPCVCYGGADPLCQARDLELGCHILVGTPGRVKDFIERGRVELDQLFSLVLDEADRMLDMGFGPQVRAILSHPTVPPPDQRQTAMFSATFPSTIQQMAAEYLRPDYLFLTVGRVGDACENIEQVVIQVAGNRKREELRRLLDETKRQRTLIFVQRKLDADALDDYLHSQGYPCTSIHGDRTQIERERALFNFRKGRLPILVATDVASRGLDIPDVAHVVVYDMPKNIEDYVHRIGRTARAGNVGRATTFISPRDDAIARDLMEALEKANQPVPEFLTEMASGSVSGYGGQDSGYGGRDVRYGGFGSKPKEPRSDSSRAYPSQGSSGSGNRDEYGVIQSSGGYRNDRQERRAPPPSQSHYDVHNENRRSGNGNRWNGSDNAGPPAEKSGNGWGPAPSTEIGW